MSEPSEHASEPAPAIETSPGAEGSPPTPEEEKRSDSTPPGERVTSSRPAPPRPSMKPSVGPKLEPIRAMRVIAIGTENPPTTDSQRERSEPPPAQEAAPAVTVPPASGPVVESEEATIEDLGDALADEADDVEPARAAPSLADGLHAEPVHAEPVHAEPARIESVGVEPVDAETAHALSDDDLIDSTSEEPPRVAPAPPPPSRGPRPAQLAGSGSISGSVGLNDETKAQLEELEAPGAPEGADTSSGPRKPPPPQRSAKPALPAATKPRKKPWWEEVFGDDFSRAHKPLSEAQVAREADFISSSLELERGSVILDLCCGQGQHAVELSRRGFPVVGYDLSVFQLAMAADLAQAARQKINFLQGDMREMAFDSMFDAVVSWDTSFGYFEEEKNLDVVKRIFSALKPGGSFLLDVMNRDYAAREAPNNHWFEGDGCICMDDMSLDWITSRLKVKRSVILDDGRSKELTFSIRLYNLSEIGKLLHDVGFRVLSVSGHTSTPGAFLGSRSPRIIIRAQRPGG